MRNLAVSMLVVGLLACGHGSAPTPVTELPVLQRELAPLTVDGNRRLLIPRDAMLRRAGVPGVFVMDQGQARFRMIRPGHALNGTVEVAAGLHGDELLVTGNLDEVHDGSPIQPIQP